jgi:HemY protein
MRAVVWFILLALVAVVTATTLGSNDGLVTFYWSGWRTDVSLNLFILVVLAACFVLVTVIQGLRALLSLPERARDWRLAQRERAAQSALREALAMTFGGRYSRAYRSAQRALVIQADTPSLADDREFKLLAHLLAAGSLHRLQDRARRDEQLAKALESGTSSSNGGRAADDGARLLAAEWALDDRDASRALELLADLPPGVARRTQALRLKLQAARLARQPQDALRTARLLSKHQAFSRGAAHGLLRSLAFEALDTARDPDQLRRVWLDFDSADRRDAFVAARAATRMAELGASEEARNWLRPFFDDLADFNEDDRAALAGALATAREGLGVDWLPRLELAVQQFPREGALAYAVGTVLAERKLWGKARRLLEQAAADETLDAAMRRQAWRDLARIADEEGDEDRAAAYHRSAARVA